MRRYLIFIKDIVQYIIERLWEKKKYDKYVLMFHVVSDNTDDWYENDYSISLKSFKKIVEDLQEDGYHFVTPEEITKFSSGKFIVLSFDDAFECVYYYVYPYLKQKKIPFVVFQSLEFLNKDPYMKDYMIKEMLSYEGFELGGHLLEHLRMAEMLKTESLFAVIESKRKLEDIFNTKLTYMTYPYGSYSSVRICDRNNVKKAGYLGAFSTVSIGFNKQKVNPFFIPRININEKNYRHIVERCCARNGK